MADAISLPPISYMTITVDDLNKQIAALKADEEVNPQNIAIDELAIQEREERLAVIKANPQDNLHTQEGEADIANKLRADPKEVACENELEALLKEMALAGESLTWMNGGIPGGEYMG
ncbi:MAG: hypothetical protein HY069_00260 [Chlamydiia bacterium]|nr:hypothetical protein [Chlamydiia bacterium]